jgi:hypothetical protein
MTAIGCIHESGVDPTILHHSCALDSFDSILLRFTSSPLLTCPPFGFSSVPRPRGTMTHAYTRSNEIVKSSPYSILYAKSRSGNIHTLSERKNSGGTKMTNSKPWHSFVHFHLLPAATYYSGTPHKFDSIPSFPILCGCCYHRH